MKLSMTLAEQSQTVLVEEARLDASIATAFKDRMREMIQQGRPLIVLDLRNVEFMDSSGLGALISILKSMPVGKRLELTGLTPNVERVLRLTHMDEIFHIYQRR